MTLNEFLSYVGESCVNGSSGRSRLLEQWQRDEERISIENTERDEEDHRYGEDWHEDLDEEPKP